MNRELEQAYFDDFIELKRFIERMGSVILEVISIQYVDEGIVVFYWATRTEQK